MPASPVAVLDVGNTALKAVLFDAEGRVLASLRFPFAAGLPALPPEFAAAAEAVAVSVHEGHLATVERALGRSLRVLGRDFRGLPSAPPGTGLDRVCAAVAAHARAGGAATAAGVGTAITVDAVDAAGRFLGGAIAPGLRSAAAGLVAAAPRLPPPDLAPGGPAPYPGRSTAEALRAGHLIGFAGLVDRLLGEAGEGPAFLHGGDAPVLLPFLRRPVVHAPDLVAEGARIVWLREGGAA